MLACMECNVYGWLLRALSLIALWYLQKKLRGRLFFTEKALERLRAKFDRLQTEYVAPCRP